jgi:hypothetical protein
MPVFVKYSTKFKKTTYLLRKRFRTQARVLVICNTRIVPFMDHVPFLFIGPAKLVIRELFQLKRVTATRARAFQHSVYRVLTCQGTYKLESARITIYPCKFSASARVLLFLYSCTVKAGAS